MIYLEYVKSTGDAVLLDSQN